MGTNDDVPFGNRVEVKNLNSVKAVAKAIEHEVGAPLCCSVTSVGGCPAPRHASRSKSDRGGAVACWWWEGLGRLNGLRGGGRTVVASDTRLGGWD